MVDTIECRDRLSAVRNVAHLIDCLLVLHGLLFPNELFNQLIVLWIVVRIDSQYLKWKRSESYGVRSDGQNFKFFAMCLYILFSATTYHSWYICLVTQREQENGLLENPQQVCKICRSNSFCFNMLKIKRNELVPWR